jgi:hypothetical protein
MLDEFIAANRSEIITRCRAKASTRSEPALDGADDDRGVPLFVDQLLTELRHGPSAASAIASTAMQHGHDLLLQGYPVSQVVREYGDVCQAVTDLAVEHHAAISVDDFRTLNRCLDDAIASAVTEYGRERDQAGERGDSIDGARRRGMARDLRKSIAIAKAAFEAIKSGKVGVAGSTGTVLSLGLDTASELAERLLAEG